MRLKDKVVLIAGAGGPMGTAIPLLFAQEGARVVLAARREAPLQALVERISAAGGQAALVTADFTTAEGAERAVAAAEEAYGRLDVLYDNLGESYARITIDETTEEQWDYLIAINLKTAYQSAHAAVPALRRSGGGVIIFSSAAQDTRIRNHSGYAATKSGLIGLTQNLARAYRAENIRVLCIAPGRIGSNEVPTPVGPPDPTLDRGGLPEDVAYAAVYLASDEAAWITGITLPVEGGSEVSYINP